jgi:hypothetical protein
MAREARYALRASGGDSVSIGGRPEATIKSHTFCASGCNFC